MSAAATTTEEDPIVPRWMVAGIVAILVLLLVADVGAQFVVPGHAASPVLDGALLTIIGGVIAASRGPQPATHAPTEPEPDPVDAAPPRRRHRAPDHGDQP